jgi:hypothetical protein
MPPQEQCAGGRPPMPPREQQQKGQRRDPKYSGTEQPPTGRWVPEWLLVRAALDVSRRESLPGNAGYLSRGRPRGLPTRGLYSNRPGRSTLGGFDRGFLVLPHPKPCGPVCRTAPRRP